MPRRAVLSGLVLLAAAPAAGQSLQLDQVNRVLSGKDLAFLADKVRAEDLPCRRADKGAYIGQDARGRRFRIVCDGEKFTYRILQRDQKRFQIEPEW